MKQHFASQSGPDGPWRPRATIRVSETFYTQTSSEGDPLTPGDIGYKSEEQSIIGLGGPLLQKTGAGMAGATARSSYTIESDPEGGSITFTADPPHYMLETIVASLTVRLLAAFGKARIRSHSVSGCG